MRTSWWMAGLLASSLGVGGCARNVKEDPQKLGRVPFAEKEQIFAAEHNIEVAQANQAASRREREVVEALGGLGGRY